MLLLTCTWRNIFLLALSLFLRSSTDGFKWKWQHVHRYLPMCMRRCFETEILPSFPFLLKTANGIKNGRWATNACVIAEIKGKFELVIN